MKNRKIYLNGRLWLLGLVISSTKKFFALTREYLFITKTIKELFEKIRGVK
jgi:hypothetical protein